MIRLAGVRFRENWKVYDFDATDVDVIVGDKVIVDSDRGPSFAQVVRLRRMPVPAAPVAGKGKKVEVEIELSIDGVEEDLPGTPPSPESRQAATGFRRVLRKATEDDLARQARNQAKEKEAFIAAQEMIAERDLPMKLIRVEYTFDAQRATFFFFSESRVDFRDLVKDLAHKLKSRIEMRQIGVRDVARMIGGFGPCGRELCCAAFLKNFEPVSIRMAKKQDMVLNPAKISGVCGRLLCCLSYEFAMYDEIKKDLAGMREAQFKEKREEEELKKAEQRKEQEEQRLVEEKRRQEDRKQQDQRREKPKDGGQKGGGRQEKKKEPQKAQQEKKPQQERKPQPERKPQQERRPQQERKPQPERKPQAGPEALLEQPVDEQKLPQDEQQGQQADQAQNTQQDGDNAARKKRRRFWRKKKKGPGGVQPGGGPQPGAA